MRSTTPASHTPASTRSWRFLHGLGRLLVLDDGQEVARIEPAQQEAHQRSPTAAT